MAAIDKRSNGRWRVRIRNRRAPTLSKTFTRKADAMKWARDTEILIEQGYAVAYFGGSKEEIDMKHMANREKLLRESAVSKADYDAAVAKMSK